MRDRSDRSDRPDSNGRPDASRDRDASPPPAAPAKTHVVAKGETLSSIARAELGSSTRWKELARWNGIDDPSALKEGTPLRLAPADGSGPSGSSGAAKPTEKPVTLEPPRVGAEPEARTHTLEKGETLSKVAARYLGDAGRWREIQKLNGIADPANLQVGSTLKLPAH